MLPPAPLAVFSSPEEASESVFPTPRPTLPTTPPTVLTVPNNNLLVYVSTKDKSDRQTWCNTSNARSETTSSIADATEQATALLGLLGRVVVVRHFRCLKLVLCCVWYSLVDDSKVEMCLCWVVCKSFRWSRKITTKKQKGQLFCNSTKSRMWAHKGGYTMWAMTSFSWGSCRGVCLDRLDGSKTRMSGWSCMFIMHRRHDVGENEMVAFEYGILTSSVQPVVLTSHSGYEGALEKKRWGQNN